MDKQVKPYSKHPSKISSVSLTGESLTLEEVVAVARYKASVSLSEQTREKVKKCRGVLDLILKQPGVIAYGITTGFGALRDRILPLDQIDILQKRLIESHACGVGRPLSCENARAVILLRANTLAKGYSGIRLETLEALINLLEKGIYPYIPEQGSLGASGDLAPLAHLSLVLIGHPDGRFLPPDFARKEPYCNEFISSTYENLKKYGFTPVSLTAKEGLALINGTQVMTGISAICHYDSRVLLRTAEMATALSFEACKGIPDALDERIHRARPLPFQQEVAARLSDYIKESEIIGIPVNTAYLKRGLDSLEDFCGLIEQKKQDVSIKDEIKVMDSLIEEIRLWENEIRPLLHKEGIENWILKGLSSFSPETREVTSKKLMPILALQHIYTPFLKNLRNITRTILDISSIVSLFPKWQTIYNLIQKAIPSIPEVQDNYSLRCAPQVIASAYNALSHAENVLSIEINSATDNPLIFPPEEYTISQCIDSVISGGNFHGEPVGMVMDYLAIALSEVGSISERRIAQIVDESFNRGLPAFLTPKSGLNSGFMIPQYTAASLVSENKILAHPATVDSIPSSANTEDHVSMGTIAARKCARILEHVRTIIAIELLTSYQALGFRGLKPGHMSLKLINVIENLEGSGHKNIGFHEEDTVLFPEIDAISQAIQREAFYILDP